MNRHARHGRLLLDAYLGAIIRWAADHDATIAALRDELSAGVDTIINGLRP